MEVEYLQVILDENDKKDKATIESLKSKSLTGKFPMLELSDGKTYISEPLSIARFLSSDKYGFYGPDAIEKAKTDQWIDLISTEVSAYAKQLVLQVTGFVESEIREFSK